MIDSVIKENTRCYAQILLEEYKYEQKMIKIENIIDDDLESK